MMLIASGQIGKCCRAITALVWPVSRMRIHMSCKLLRLSKAMTTDSTKYKQGFDLE